MDKKKFDKEKEFDIENTASSMECTGLIPSKPDSEDEISSYQDIYSFLQEPIEETKEYDHEKAGKEHLPTDDKYPHMKKK